MDAKTELLLYIAARRQHLVEKVLPELKMAIWLSWIALLIPR